MRDPKATQGPISHLLPLANAICKGLGAKQRVLMSVAKTARANRQFLLVLAPLGARRARRKANARRAPSGWRIAITSG